MSTLFERIWQAHVVCEPADRPPLLYIDRHLVHEVTSPQAFEALRQTGRRVRRPDLTLATLDHNLPTTDRHLPISDPFSAKQIAALERNCRDFKITLYGMGHERQGIVHVIGPELGFTLPGLTMVCGDSHTATHGAFGALAFGIGTSEVEHVLATQCLPQAKPKTMAVRFTGKRQPAVTAKDMILAFIGEIGAGGGTGHVIEYLGDLVRDLSMEERMTICSMSVECGARAGMIAPDEKTYEYVAGRPLAPNGRDFERAVEWWRRLPSDANAVYDKEVTFDISSLEPQVTWGTSLDQVVGVTAVVPDPISLPDGSRRRSAEQALEYMGLLPGTPICDIRIDRVFIGSCTNGRIEDLRAAAEIARGKTVARSVRAMVVPGSQAVKGQAEREGLDRIFRNAGFEWRESGCSMCLGMNPDILQPGERCASTTNRNFEGRQGRGGRTHLVSPQMAAAAAIEGRFVDVREWVTQEVARW